MYTNVQPARHAGLRSVSPVHTTDEDQPEETLHAPFTPRSIAPDAPLHAAPHARPHRHTPARPLRPKRAWGRQTFTSVQIDTHREVTSVPERSCLPEPALRRQRREDRFHGYTHESLLHEDTEEEEEVALYTSSPTYGPDRKPGRGWEQIEQMETRGRGEEKSFFSDT